MMKGTYMGYEYDMPEQTATTVSEPPDRFDFEQQIMDCWNIITDLDIVHESIGSEEMTLEKVKTMLKGISELYALKFVKVFDTFEVLIRNGDLG